MNRVRAALGRYLASLNGRITLGALAGLVLGAAVVTWVLLASAERNTLLASEDRQLDEVSRTALVVSHRIVELQTALSLVSKVTHRGMMDNPAEVGAFLLARPYLRSQFGNVFVARPDGHVVIFTEHDRVKPVTLNLADRDYFVRTLREGRALVSEPVPGRISAEPVVVFTQSLRDDKGIYGVLGAGLRLAERELLTDIVDLADPQIDRLFIVTDAGGKILAHADRGRLLHSVADEPRLAQAWLRWREMGQPVEPSGLHIRQPGQVVSIAGVAGPDWVVWQAVSDARLLAPLRQARTQALIWAALLTALFAAATIWFVRRMLLPLKQLEARAEHIFDAQLDLEQGWPESQDEIGALAQVLRQAGREQARLERLNRQALQRLGSVMEAVPVGVAFTRAQNFELVSAEMCRMLGRSESELLGKPAQIIYASYDDYVATGPKVTEAFQAGRPYTGEIQMQRADGSRFWAQLRGRPLDPNDPGAGTSWSVTDITAEVENRVQLEWSATHDVLTGLANRKGLEAPLERVFNARPRSMPAGLIMIDLDRFKPINDQWGHAAGDAMLKAVAVAITARVRAQDVVARLGGDEFAVLLERCPAATAERVAQSIRAAVAQITLPWAGSFIQVGCSAGLAELSEDHADSAAWLATADAACYVNKAAGRAERQTQD